MSQPSHRGSTPGRIRLFRRLNTIVLVLLGLLILAGGIVRSSGAGMGCPDWPRCFGQLIPPLHESELPSDYQRIYAERGYADTRFNAVKTWTEYLNRLLGALTGLAVLLHFIFSLRAYGWRLKNVVFWSLVALLLVLLQGGVGAWVVMTHLRDGVVTLHFVLALAVVGAVLKARFLSNPVDMLALTRDGGSPSYLGLRWQAWMVLGLMLIQIVLGTQVRERVDEWVRLQGDGQTSQPALFRSLGIVFEWHRNFWMVVLMACFYFYYSIDRMLGRGPLRNLALGVLLFIGLQVLTGGMLTRLRLPVVPRALHILLGSLSFSLMLALALRLEEMYRKMLRGTDNSTELPQSIRERISSGNYE